MKELYKIDFTVMNNDRSEYLGFEADKTAEFFEAGWNLGLLWHDIFEHFFEMSEYFNTEELSRAGECVAMGIRSYFADHTSYVQDYTESKFNRGLENNSWELCIGQILDALTQDNIEYSLDFNYNPLSEWDGENVYESYSEAYSKTYGGIDSEIGLKIELAFSYGYWLGEYLFSNLLTEIASYMDNLKLFLELIEIPTDAYEIHESNIDGLKFKVSVRESEIVSKFGSIYITSNQSEDTIHTKAQEFRNKYEYQYEY